MNIGRRGLSWLVLAVACGGPSGTVNPNGGDGYGQGPGSGSDDGSNTGNGVGISGDGDAPDTHGGDGSDGGASNVCQEFAVNATPTTPDMLIVLDRSQSMEVFGRWDPSVAAT